MSIKLIAIHKKKERKKENKTMLTSTRLLFPISSSCVNFQTSEGARGAEGFETFVFNNPCSFNIISNYSSNHNKYLINAAPTYRYT